MLESVAALHPKYEEWYKIGELEHDVNCVTGPCQQE